MPRHHECQSLRVFISLVKRILRGLVFALVACVILLSLNFVRNWKEYKHPQDKEVIHLKGKHEKIVMKDVDGRKIFEIVGLPAKQNRGFRKIFQPTTLPLKVKAVIAEKVEAIYERRLTKLRKSCGRKKPSQQWSDRLQLISVPKLDLTVCVVQKAASTSWHRLVYSLREPKGTWNGLGHQLNRNHTRNLPLAEKERLMNTKKGMRVITVRHPFARLISGWNDKLNKNHLSDSTRILSSLPDIEKYIQKSVPDDDHIIAFEDFAQYIADRGLKGIDVHFRTIEQLCQPCRYPYGYITKTETSQKNLWWVLDKVGGEMPSFGKHIASASSDDILDKSSDPWEKEKKVMTAFFKKMPFETVVKLKTLYRDDFNRFGYTFDLNTMTAGDVVD